MDKIEAQTKELSDQLKKLESVPEGDDEQYIKELEKYQAMLKQAVFSPEAQAASKKRELKWYDKAFAPIINRTTRQVNKINKKLIEYNRRGKK